MQPQTIRKHKLFWAWQDDREEAWLESMSREGWHLQDVCFLTYTFARGEPQEWAYRLDFRPGRDLPQYLEFVQEAGWHYLGSVSGWLYFRLPARLGQPTELYTDPEGKIAKYRRVLGVLLLTCPVYGLVVLRRLNHWPPWYAAPLFAFLVAAICLYVVALVKLIGRINQLKRI